MSTTERTSWGLWSCTSCGNPNISGKLKRCPTCGDPREQDELDAIRPPGDFRDHITDEEELRLAHDGPDWHCERCGSANRASATECVSCGASRPPARQRPTPAAPAGPPKWHQNKIVRRVGGGFLAVNAVIGVVAWGSMEKSVAGVVSEMTWEHTVALEQWTDVSSGGWAPVVERSEIPPKNGVGEVAGVRITSCRQKHHHDESYACGTENYTDTEQYQCGSTPSRSCTTVNNGNGSFTERCSTTYTAKYCSRQVTRTRTKYCTRPVYRRWCDYMTQAWDPLVTETDTGRGQDFTWPTIVPPGAEAGDLAERRTVKRARYVLQLVAEDGAHHTSRAVSREVYEQWAEGDAVTLRVKNIGGVKSVPEIDNP